MRICKGAVLFLLSLYVCLPGFLFPQEETEKLKEHVDVVHVELLVRAIKKGDPVPGLKPKDFILLENGKQVPVSSVTEVKRRIASTELDLKAVREKTVKQKPRFFILYFWIHEVQLNIDEALDHFFSDIYHSGDVVILATRDKYFQILSSEEVWNTCADFLEHLRQMAKFIEIEEQSRFNEIERQCNAIKRILQEMQRNTQDDQGGTNIQALTMQLNQRRDELRSFINNEWKVFRLKYLDAHMGQLEALAEGLGKVKMERWGLVFFQYPIFSTLDFRNQFVMDTILNEEMSIQWMSKFFQPENTSQLDRIRDAFFSANATFHLLLMDSKTKDRYVSDYINVQYVASGSEEVFRKISRATGGETVMANKMYEGLKQVSESDDVYYVLTYSPAESDQRNRKINIRGRDRGIRMIHLNRVDMNRVKSIKVSDVLYSYPVLNFAIKDYRMLADKGELSGQVALGLRAEGPDDYDEFFSREFQLTAEEVHGSMTLYLPEGEYKLTLEVVDKNANTRDSLETTINVQPPADGEE